MKTSPSSSSTMSTSITVGSPLSAIGFLVLSVFGVGVFGVFGRHDPVGSREKRRGLLIVRDLDGLQEFGGHGFLRHRQGEVEPRAAGEGGVEPDPAAEVLDDLPGHGQADA